MSVFRLKIKKKKICQWEFEIFIVPFKSTWK